MNEANSSRRRATDNPRDGRDDLNRAVERLARRLPEPLEALARLAYNYQWSWLPDGREVFSELSPHRFNRVAENPVRLLRDLPETTLLRAAADTGYVERVRAVDQALDRDLHRDPVAFAPAVGDPEIAFCCAEFAIHASLPVYSGGLGVLAGDILKQASDLAYPMIGVGLLYRRGYFHQRLDLSGWQHEYWVESDPDLMPIARVTDADGEPMTVVVPLWDDEVTVAIWRADVGRVPLYLLDAELAENEPRQRWVTARLYEGTRQLRLAQYALLGVGGVRALSAMGRDPGLFHLNEGHPALATLAVAAANREPGQSTDSLLDATRERFVFTTHTPVPAGNETYATDEFESALGAIAPALGFETVEVLQRGRINPNDDHEPVGLTALALRGTRSTNGVSRLHGQVSRAMWQPLFPDRTAETVPISHVTNGVHIATWMAPPMRSLLDRHLGIGWIRAASHPDTWSGIDAIPDAELWAARCELRSDLVAMLRNKVAIDRLARGEDLDFVRDGENAFDPETLTFGFARRLATYKRLGLLVLDPDRALRLLTGVPSIQIAIAGKAHPQDDGGKRAAQRVFELKRLAPVGQRVAFVEDYDLRIARTLVAGCDVWINVPRPPLEASGTSGMKALLNGGLNLSVMDGWWAEAYDGTNGWGFHGSEEPDENAADAIDAATFFDIIENDVAPMFHERDANGLPLRWLQRMRASLKTLAPTFSAQRMVEQYGREIYHLDQT